MNVQGRHVLVSMCNVELEDGNLVNKMAPYFWAAIMNRIFESRGISKEDMLFYLCN